MYLEILRKNPRSVFRLQERNPGDIDPIPQKNNKFLLPAIVSAGVVLAAIITLFSMTSKCSGSENNSLEAQTEQNITINERL